MKIISPRRLRGILVLAAAPAAMSPITFSPSRGFVPAAGAEVHVFDWDGTLRARYELDALTLGIAAHPAGSALYAIRHEPQPAVLRYPLPPG